MKIHQVKQCCCGCSLEAGTKIIAWMEMICGIIVVVLSIVLVVVDSENSKFGMYVGNLVGGIFTTIMGVTLHIGALKRRAHLLNVWIVITLIGLALYAIGAIIEIILTMIAGQFGAGIGVLISSLIGLLITYYFIMVVSSYQQTMVANNGV